MVGKKQYWKQLISMGLRFLQEQNNDVAATVIKKATFDVEYSFHDNWDGGIDYWDLVFYLKYRDYIALGEKKEQVEIDILSALNTFHKESRDLISTVTVRPIIEQYIDWRAVHPYSKDNVIQMIYNEQKMLTEVATGELSFKKEGAEERYHDIHKEIIAISNKAGFEYPITANSLAEWWGEIKKLPTYADRRAFISKEYSQLLHTLLESDEDDASVSFQQIATYSETIQKAVEDAEIFIREGRYDSAFDRIHTAFYGYVKHILTEHNVQFETDDSLPALFTKLHEYYCSHIQPADVGSRIKTILRSTGGIINTINELRNNNTVAHPNGYLIQKREAQLVIRIVNAVVDYIEDVEKGL